MVSDARKMCDKKNLKSGMVTELYWLRVLIRRV